jgi:ribonuclease J
VGFLPVAHSLPESSALVIDTPAGRILHSADFKLDPTPGIGDPWVPEAWAATAREVPGGVKVLVCDSTNVLIDHPGRSEVSIAPAIERLIAGRNGLVLATTFASNVARLKTLADAAVSSGRLVCLLGRAMKRMVTAALETGLLRDFPRTVSPEEAAAIPRRNLMLLATGSQGERRAAVAQFSRGKYLGLSLTEGDLVLFSSRTIPGNERDVLRLVNAFSEMGVDVVDDAGGVYHISGHANRPDLEIAHDLVKPGMILPMHGEHRHLRAHARLAAERGYASEVVTNGMMVELSGEAPEVVEYIETGRIYLDGSALVGATDGVVRDRIRMALNGHVLVTLILDEDGAPMGEPWVELMGLPERGRSPAPLAETLESELAQAVARAGRDTMADDDKLDEALRRVVRQVAMEEIGKKPEVTVVVSRLVAD